MRDCADIERSFPFLKLSGVFEKVSGIILGKHELFNDCKTGRKPYEILLDVLLNLMQQIKKYLSLDSIIEF